MIRLILFIKYFTNFKLLKLTFQISLAFIKEARIDLSKTFQTF